uniref:Uncharacterized protein n=1 Tax=Rhizophora mucronata TaxID=61149 RepID=A0A2P2PDR8_RHIMU
MIMNNVKLTRARPGWHLVFFPFQLVRLFVFPFLLHLTAPVWFGV